MPYIKNVWVNGDPTKPVNASRLGHGETQYDEAMADVEAAIGDAGTGIGAALSSTIESGVASGIASSAVETINVTTSAALDDALTAVAAGAFPRSIRIPHGAHITRTTGVNISTANLRHLRIDGKVEFQADVIGFLREGAPGAASQKTCSAITAGDRTIAVNGVAGLSVGDRVFIIANDTVPNSSDKVGYMREITTISGLNVGIDVAIPRSISSSVRLKQLALAPSICIGGDGEVFYDNPEAYVSAMFSFKYAEDVTFERPLTLRDGGGTCIVLGHVNGFSSTATIDRFIDDTTGGHYGYGVSAGGASRNGYVGGRISRCRHAFTTNAGPADATFNFYGEPDNWLVEPLTYACKDKALDTHRVGWAITLRLNDSGSGGGVHVRADNCYVDGRSDGGKVGAGVWVESVVTVPATIGPMHFSNHAGDGILLEGPAKLTSFPTCINLTGDPFSAAAGVAYTIADTSYVVKGSDQSVNSGTTGTTMVDVVDMSIPVDAFGIYELGGQILNRASQAGDISFSWTAPTRTVSSGVTFTDAGDLVTVPAHGASVGDTVVFGAITSTTGVVAGTVYYVKTTPSANTMTISATRGGSTLGLTTDGTAASARFDCALAWNMDGLSTGATSTGGSVARTAGSVGSTLSVGGVGAGDSVAYPRGILTVGSTGGTLQLRFAQLVADATDSIVRAGSRVSLRRIG